MQLVWSRRPAKAVARLGGRKLLVMSARELLRAAAREGVMLVALAAPAPAAIAGFARAARPDQLHCVQTHLDTLEPFKSVAAASRLRRGCG